jgi:hypothetical protein
MSSYQAWQKDDVTGKHISRVQGEMLHDNERNLDIQREILRNSNSSTRLQDEILKSSIEANRIAKDTYKLAYITNDELKRLNVTTSRIEEANNRLIELQSTVLNRVNKQIAISEELLQIGRINELERHRQNEIKQAAFSVDEKITESEKYKGVKKYFMLREQLYQVEMVGLTADIPHEIIDKKYVKNVLQRLNQEIIASQSQLATDEINEVDDYLNTLPKLWLISTERDEAQYQLNQIIDNAIDKPNLLQGMAKFVFYPDWIKLNNSRNNLVMSTIKIVMQFIMRISFPLILLMFIAAKNMLLPIIYGTLYLVIYAFAERKYHIFKVQHDNIYNHYIELDSDIDNYHHQINQFKAKYHL